MRSKIITPSEREAYHFRCICVHKCSASYALIKDIKLKNIENSVGANCVRPRAFAERPYEMYVKLSLPQRGKGDRDSGG